MSWDVNAGPSYQKSRFIDVQEGENKSQARDKRDSERELAPLKPAADAIQLDSSGLGIEEVFERVLAEAKIRLPSL
jgi:cytidylate kinase